MTTSATTTASGSSAVSGLISGIDTASLVKSLISAAAGPQTLLKGKLATVNTQVTALQKINTQTAAVGSAASALAKPSAWTATAATSTDASVTLATNGNPPAASITFDVTKLATKHSVATDPITDPGDGSLPEFSITASDGTVTQVQADSWNASSIANAVNASSAGVKATILHDTSGDRVLMTSAATGSASAFTVGAPQYDPVTLQQTDPGLVTTVAHTGTDAELQLGGVQVHSASNTFTGLLSGVDLTVSTLASDVTVGIDKDTKGITSQVSGMVDSLNVLLANIAFQTQASPSTTSGTASKTNGVLVGDQTTNSLTQSFLSALSGGIGGASLSAVGISVDQDGNADFDKTAFASFLASNPARAQSLVMGLASKLSKISTAASDPYAGSISKLISGDQSTVKDLTDRISDWDDRLALRQTTLQNQFNAMESALSNLQGQSSALTSALAGLSSSS